MQLTRENLWYSLYCISYQVLEHYLTVFYMRALPRTDGPIDSVQVGLITSTKLTRQKNKYNSRKLNHGIDKSVKYDLKTRNV